MEERRNSIEKVIENCWRKEGCPEGRKDVIEELQMSVSALAHSSSVFSNVQNSHPMISSDFLDSFDFGIKSTLRETSPDDVPEVPAVTRWSVVTLFGKEWSTDRASTSFSGVLAVLAALVLFFTTEKDKRTTEFMILVISSFVAAIFSVWLPYTGHTKRFFKKHFVK
uniref:Pecanex-like protein n=2 Tax=Caenorhabditis tropicalis TaxID=1561998 RepID=A0A1I7UD17_9PELO